MKKALTRKQKESYQCILRLYEGAWISADSTGIWKIDRGEINIISIFQNQAVGVKWIYPQNPGIAKSN